MIRDCPWTYNVQFIQADKIDDIVQQLLVRKDIEKVQLRAKLSHVEEESVTEMPQEGFHDGSK